MLTSLLEDSSIVIWSLIFSLNKLIISSLVLTNSLPSIVSPFEIVLFKVTKANKSVYIKNEDREERLQFLKSQKIKARGRRKRKQKNKSKKKKKKSKKR